MFTKAIRSMKHARKSDFSAYMANLNRGHETNGPTVDEARKDYKAAARSRSIWKGF